MKKHLFTLLEYRVCATAHFCAHSTVTVLQWMKTYSMSLMLVFLSQMYMDIHTDIYYDMNVYAQIASQV